MKILIIDDSFFQRKVISNMISDIGHEPILAASGEEGLGLFSTIKPDGVILDLLMPRLSGKEILKKLQDEGNEVPIVILSADIQKSVEQACLNLGASFFLHKPLVKEELQNCINNF